MTTAAILNAINSLPTAERMRLIEKVIRTIRLEKSDNANPSGPSPSGDPWYDDPCNIAIVKEGIKNANEAKEKGIVLASKEDIENYFANL